MTFPALVNAALRTRFADPFKSSTPPLLTVNTPSISPPLHASLPDTVLVPVKVAPAMLRLVMAPEAWNCGPNRTVPPASTRPGLTSLVKSNEPPVMDELPSPPKEALSLVNTPPLSTTLAPASAANAPPSTPPPESSIVAPLLASKVPPKAPPPLKLSVPPPAVTAPPL